MTRRMWGLILACGMVIGMADTAKAQFSLTIGNPYLGSGLSIGAPAYGYSYNSFSSYGYGVGGLYGAPIVTAPVVGAPFVYSSGYRGFGPPPPPPPPPFYRGFRGGPGFGPGPGFRPGPFRGYGGFRR
ncbi:hypothetical protein TA3x_001477 [Tundrisphaera sp. TA3]|uniref:hypothetical protein n=1 Tax=Tundrisphaera sp. TA3 TaxID=3435775 RepID=UPI003EBFCC40